MTIAAEASFWPTQAIVCAVIAVVLFLLVRYLVRKQRGSGGGVVSGGALPFVWGFLMVALSVPVAIQEDGVPWLPLLAGVFALWLGWTAHRNADRSARRKRREVERAVAREVLSGELPPTLRPQVPPRSYLAGVVALIIGSFVLMAVIGPIGAVLTVLVMALYLLWERHERKRWHDELQRLEDALPPEDAQELRRKAYEAYPDMRERRDRMRAARHEIDG